MQIISIYDHEGHSANGGTRDIDSLFDDIKKGRYKSEVEIIRNAKYNFKLEEERVNGSDKITIQNDQKYQKAKSLLKELKGKIHRVTISGKFSDTGRLETNLITHSGLIDIDIDKQENLQVLKDKLILDKYCQACFLTCGGDGLAFICRIDPNKHNESWEGLKSYLYEKYHVSIDTSHKNVANTRNVSYDPDIYVRDNKATIFKEYPKVEKKKAVKNQFIYAKDDFEEIIKEISSRKIDFCGSKYEDFVNIGFSIASKFGELGFDYFDSICQWGDAYNPQKIKKEYSYFCKNRDGGRTIATFYARCKELGINTSSEKTKKIAKDVTASKKGGKDKETTLKNLEKFGGYKLDEIQDITNQIFDDKIEFEESDTLLDEIQSYIRLNCDLRKNQISGKLENYGIEWSEEDLNGLYVDIKKAYDKADAKWIERVIFSPFIKSYNPIRDFFLSNLDKQPDELLDKGEIPSIIKKFWNAVNTDNPKFLIKFGTKWLVGIVAAAFGDPSNLELDFTGKMNKGKSHFFKHLLPTPLLKYFAESKLDSNNQNDDYTMMCQKLLILMDECAGKTRADEKKHRNLLDKIVFSIRRPYRKDLEDMQRLAVLCGTSNPQNLLNGDNRRIIPINLLSRDHKAYDEIDKTELFMALYYLWKDGFEWRIGENDISELNSGTLWSQDYSTEYELLTKYYEKDEKGEIMTVTDIKVILDGKSGLKLSQSKLRTELDKLNFIKGKINENGIERVGYKVRFKDDNRYAKLESQPFD